MKYVRLIILFIAFVGLVLYATKAGKKEYDKQNQVLKKRSCIGRICHGYKEIK